MSRMCRVYVHGTPNGGGTNAFTIRASDTAAFTTVARSAMLLTPVLASDPAPLPAAGAA